MIVLKKVRSVLFYTLVLGLVFGSYSCEKESSNINSSNNDGSNGGSNDDHDCDTPLEYHEITFSGTDLEEWGSKEGYFDYKFEVDTNIVQRTVNYLMDWGCSGKKQMFLELNGTKIDSLSPTYWDQTDHQPGSTSFHVGNKNEIQNESKYTTAMRLVENGIGESTLTIKDTAYPDFGLENFYDPNGEYKIIFAYYEE